MSHAATLTGRTAIVTGAARGIGAAIAHALGAAGANLVLCDLLAAVEDVAGEAARAGRSIGLRADVSLPNDVDRVVEAARSAFGAIDLLVANAGAWRPSHPLEAIDRSLEDHRALVGTNFRGAFLFGRAVMREMIERRRGDIVIVSTDHVCTCGAPESLDHADAPACPWAGGPPRPTGGGKGMDLYDASKWALNGLTYSWAQALRPYGVRVNALCMGATDTAMVRSLYDGDPPADVAASWMQPSDIAAVLLDLLAEGPAGRTGENIGIAVGHPRTLSARRAPRYWGEPTVDVASPRREPAAAVEVGLEGSVALVSTGGSELGDEIARALRRAGMEVFAFDGDLSGAAEVERLVAGLVDRHGGLDLLVHAAGARPVSSLDVPLDEAVRDLERIFDRNVENALLLGRACAPRLVARGGGDIVLVTGTDVLPARAGGANAPDRDLANASCWALNGFTQAWALALARRAVRVNALAVSADPVPEDVASVLLALLREGPSGRSGENIGVWPGEPASLPPPRPRHRAITG